MNDRTPNVSTCGIVALLLVLILCTICSADSPRADRGPSVAIARDGEPVATIIMSPDANDVVKEAVRDLQRVIEKISGARLPIAGSARTPGNLILVGRMEEVDRLIPDLDTVDLGPDGVVIKTLPGKLILTGKSDGHMHPWSGRTDCGTPNAVYYLLEKLGCRWYMPGDDGEVVPHKPTLTVTGLDVVSRPDFDARWVRLFGATGMGADAHTESKTWLVRNRTSQNRYYEAHTMVHLLPKNTYGTSHPEYFAMMDGKRQVHARPFVQACTSNPDVIDIVHKNLTHILTSQSPWRSYAVGQYDGPGWCQCKPCLAQYGNKTFTYNSQDEAQVVGQAVSDKAWPNVANGYLKFVNAIAERVAETHPDSKVTYYALYSIPGFPEVRPRDNVLPVMSHIAPHDPAWRRQVLAWEKISRNLYYYSYFGWRMALPKLAIGEDIRWCRQHKGIAMSVEEDEYSPVTMLTLYLAAKAWWDVDTDGKQVLAEFYAKFYGPAEAPMRRFWETFGATTRRAVEDWDTHYAYPDPLTPEVAGQCREYLTKALDQADRPVLKRRIEWVSKYWRIVELQIDAQQALARWKQDRTSENQDDAKRTMKNVIEYMDSMKDEFFTTHRASMLASILAEIEKG